jgi:hypothetical protein
MLDKLTSEDFSPHVNEVFVIRFDPPQEIVLRLTSVKDIQYTGTKVDRRTPFSLIFQGPRDQYLPQQIYRMENETMGVLEIFIVPVGTDENGLYYEAVFN